MPKNKFYIQQKQKRNFYNNNADNADNIPSLNARPVRHTTIDIISYLTSKPPVWMALSCFYAQQIHSKDPPFWLCQTEIHQQLLQRHSALMNLVCQPQVPITT